jgi:uncharacterized membrane protein YadS
VPLTLALDFGVARQQSAGAEGCRRIRYFKVAVPWFIRFFLLASLLRSYVPVISTWSLLLSEIARRGVILVLFLIGTSLSLRALRTVGWRTVVTGLVLWLLVSIASLLAIFFFKLAA